MAQEAWITTQQRINLNKLVISNPDCTPADCCEIAHNLDDAHFIEAHESIGYEVSLYPPTIIIIKHLWVNLVYRILKGLVFLFKNFV